MKKKIIFLLLSLVIVLSLVLVGCSSTPSSTPPPPSTTQAAAPPSTSTAPQSTTSAAPSTSSASPVTSTPANVITLKFADQNPEQGWDAQHADVPYLNAIRKATNGQVQFQTYYSQALATGPNTWAAVQNGTADLGWMVMGYWPNMTPLADAVALPFLGLTSAKEGSNIAWQLYAKYPAISSEFNENHVLILWTSGPRFLATTKKQVKALSDWQGLKIRGDSPPTLDMIKALGGTPLMISMPDVYLDLQKGVLDGAMLPWEAVISFKLYEVVKYYTYFPSNVTYFTIAMNNNTWDKLPPNVQQEINSVSGLQGSENYGYNMFDTATTAGPEMAKKAGYSVEEYTVPQDELAKWTAIAGQPVWNAWVKKMTAAGHPEAQDILNTELQLIKNYKP